MQDLQDKKIAIVCDWIKDWWWAELVLAHLLELFPGADIYTSIFFQDNNPVFEGRKITTSFIQKIPLLNKSHKLALMLRPLAFESFDLSEYDIVISSSSAESKGVITKPTTLHICYCHTPTRYFWSHFHEYMNMMEFGILNPLARFVMPRLIHTLRKWDFCAAQRPDYFISNSDNTGHRVGKYYGREVTTIHPGITSGEFPFLKQKWDFYLYVGRCIPYKKFDLIVEAFNKNGKKLIIITNTQNKLQKSLEAISKPNIEWKVCISREETRELFAKAKCFLFPPEEDFWLVPLEAMVCGTPVIAYGKWWALETVVSWETWLFFNHHTSNSLNKAVELFETSHWNPTVIREHAMRFDKSVFQKKILTFIENKL